MVIFMYCRSPLRNCLYVSTPVFFDGIDYVALAISDFFKGNCETSQIVQNNMNNFKDYSLNEAIYHLLL